VNVNETQLLLVYADNDNLLDENTNATNKNTDVLLDSSNEKCRETKYVLSSLYQNSRQNRIMNTYHIFPEAVARLKYLGARVT
jgi:hypothetical protein